MGIPQWPLRIIYSCTTKAKSDRAAMPADTCDLVTCFREGLTDLPQAKTMQQTLVLLLTGSAIIVAFLLTSIAFSPTIWLALLVWKWNHSESLFTWD